MSDKDILDIRIHSHVRNKLGLILLEETALVRDDPLIHRKLDSPSKAPVVDEIDGQKWLISHTYNHPSRNTAKGHKVHCTIMSPMIQ
jgi:hypothetical protein